MHDPTQVGYNLTSCIYVNMYFFFDLPPKSASQFSEMEPEWTETAINDMKQYVYEPAKKNGKAVPAHVQVSLQFWYEP